MVLKTSAPTTSSTGTRLSSRKRKGISKWTNISTMCRWFIRIPWSTLYSMNPAAKAKNNRGLISGEREICLRVSWLQYRISLLFSPTKSVPSIWLSRRTSGSHPRRLKKMLRTSTRLKEGCLRLWSYLTRIWRIGKRETTSSKSLQHSNPSPILTNWIVPPQSKKP